MSSRRPAIGTNPLDQIMPPRPEPHAAEAVPATGERDADDGQRPAPVSESTAPRALPRRTEDRSRKTHRLTVKVSDQMVEELRDAVMFLHTQGVHTTLVGLIESAVDAELRRIKRKYNEGQDLPSRGADLPVGRPISA